MQTARAMQASPGHARCGRRRAPERKGEPQLHSPSHAAYIEARHLLFVCTGPDLALAMELPLLRGMRSATGIQFQRIRGATKRKFADSLNREHHLRRSIALLHMGLHASALGVQFADGCVDGSWLGKRLEDVQVLHMAAWHDSSGDSGSDSMGDSARRRWWSV